MTGAMFQKTIILLIVALAGACQAQRCAYEDYRIPENIQPIHYDLTFDVDSDKLSFDGAVKITLSVDHDLGATKNLPGNVIVLHAAPELDIKQVQYRNLASGGQLKQAAGVCRHAANELLVVTLDEKLQKGSRVELSVSFGGDVRSDTKGIYRSAYMSKSSGRYGYQISTQFEAAYARTAFPCFDEPHLKATFDVTLVHSDNRVALSNMALASEESANEGRRKSHFKRTPRMSTYLVAFVIGEFDYVEQVVSGGRLLIRTYTPVGRTHEGKFALETAVRAITLLEDYFDLPFPLEKIDMVAIPEFASAAMENWGLITYKQNYLLFNERTDSPSIKGVIASTIVHELSHQWFGNLVTMKWWNDLWLNEGFATWMQNHLTHQMYPEFEFDQYELTGNHGPALEADTSLETHSIRAEQVDGNLDKIFDKIVYSKSNSIIKYVHDVYVGPERFRAGIRSYLKKNRYANTEAANLWDELKAASNGLPVDQFMKSWITQPGHPLVQVRLADSSGKRLLLEQERHWPDAGVSHNSHQTWMIPVSILVSDGKGRQATVKVIFDKQSMEVDLPDWFEAAKESHWLMLNENSSGFYRVLYEKSLLKRLKGPCRSKEIPLAGRVNFADELRSHYQTGLLSLETLRETLGWFKGELAGSALVQLAEAFKLLLRDTRGRMDRWHIERLGQKLFAPVLKRNGLTERPTNAESFSESIGTTAALRCLIDMDYRPLVEEAVKRFENLSALKTDTLDIVLEAVAIRGPYKQRSHLQRLMATSKDPALKWAIKMALKKAKEDEEEWLKRPRS